MKKIFVDTNILIDYSKGFNRLLGSLLELQKKGEARLYINPLVIAEYYNDKNLINKKSVRIVNDFLHMFSCINIDWQTALIAGALLRTKQVLFIGDAFIAATCLSHHLFLATQNKKDFQKVKELSFYLE